MRSACRPRACSSLACASHCQGFSKGWRVGHESGRLEDWVSSELAFLDLCAKLTLIPSDTKDFGTLEHRLKSWKLPRGRPQRVFVQELVSRVELVFVE